MQAATLPTKVPLAWAASSSLKNAIPETSQIGILAGAASLPDGFPPLCFQPLAAGGVPPSGKDFNGVLNLISQSIRWANAGGMYPFDATFAGDTNVGGYPSGAMLKKSGGPGAWVSLADSNTANPDSAVSANWCDLLGLNYGVDTGTAGACVVAVPMSIPFLFDGLKIRFRVKNGNPGTCTLTLNSLASKSIFGTNGLALAGSELTANGIVEVHWNSTVNGGAGAFVLQSASGATAAASSLVGAARNLRAVLGAAGTSLTFTADEVVVASSLGARRAVLSSLNATLNVATVGANGMDTGAAPASGYVAIYTIYNPTTSTAALLATNATAAAAPNVYGGANMPAGYTLSGLISVWPTNGSSQLVVGEQIDRSLSFPSITVYSSTSPPTSPTSLSIASAVPKNARSVKGNLFIGAATSANSYAISVASDVAGSGIQTGAGYSPAGGSSSSAYSVSVSTPQTIYQWNSGTPTTGTTWGIYVTAYEI